MGVRGNYALFQYFLKLMVKKKRNCESRDLFNHLFSQPLFMGPTGFEPVTSRTSSGRSSQLSYDPMNKRNLNVLIHLCQEKTGDVPVFPSFGDQIRYHLKVRLDDYLAVEFLLHLPAAGKAHAAAFFIGKGKEGFDLFNQQIHVTAVIDEAAHIILYCFTAAGVICGNDGTAAGCILQQHITPTLTIGGWVNDAV